MDTTGERWRLGHRPALDGLRGVAVALVVLCHLNIPALDAAGSVGVTIFFTLSGFLITALLFEERRRTGRIDLLAFFLRRARRLLPALMAVVGTVALLGELGVRAAVVPSGVESVLLYVGNWSLAAGGGLGPLDHTWSLSVEEQFYVLWPLLFLAFARSARALILVAGGLSLYAVAARLVLWDDGDGWQRIYYGTDTHADGLLVGCLLAIVLEFRRDGRSRPASTAVLLVAASLFGAVGDGLGRFVLSATAVPVLTAAIIFCVARGEGVAWLSWRPLTAVGRRSYGLYLWHWPIFLAFGKYAQGPWAVPVAVAMVAIAWVVTLLSWRYIEWPFLNRPSRATTPLRTPAGSSPAETPHRTPRALAK